MNPVINIKYPYDKELLLKCAEESKKSAAVSLSELPYLNQGMYEGDYGYLGKYENDYIHKIINDFGLTGNTSARFIITAPHSLLKEHIDVGTKCAINFILSDEPAPVTYSEINYYYTQALLDVSLPHSVKNGNKERVLFKISIFDESFDKVVKKIAPYIL